MTAKVLKTKEVANKEVQVINSEARSSQISIQAQQAEQNMALIEMAINKDLDMTKLERLMAMQTEKEREFARKAFNLSLSRFQSQIPVITKRGLASFGHKGGAGKTEYSYAKLEDITEAIKPFLYDNGLSYRYEQATDDKAITVTCIVSHEQGHEERASMTAYPDQSGSKNTIQQTASTVSYLRRYTVTGALGITVADEDDDGAEVGEPAAQGVQYFDQAVFDENLPDWQRSIEEGRKSNDDVLAYLVKKNAVLSPDQIETINGIKPNKVEVKV